MHLNFLTNFNFNFKDDLLKDLEETYASKDLQISETHNSIEHSINQLNEVIKFGERIIHNGNIAEILFLKRHIINQIKHLLSNLPQVENIDTNIKFTTDEKKMEKAISEAFGRFYTPKENKQIVSVYFDFVLFKFKSLILKLSL
jgi:hypothetical protein